jgi:hypothetical protein
MVAMNLSTVVSCVPEGRSARAADGNGGRSWKVSSIYRGAEQGRKKKTEDGVVESPNQQGRVFTSIEIFAGKPLIFVVIFSLVLYILLCVIILKKGLANI